MARCLLNPRVLVATLIVLVGSSTAEAGRWFCRANRCCCSTCSCSTCGCSTCGCSTCGFSTCGCSTCALRRAVVRVAVGQRLHQSSRRPRQPRRRRTNDAAGASPGPPGARGQAGDASGPRTRNADVLHAVNAQSWSRPCRSIARRPRRITPPAPATCRAARGTSAVGRGTNGPFVSRKGEVATEEGQLKNGLAPFASATFWVGLAGDAAHARRRTDPGNSPSFAAGSA